MVEVGVVGMEVVGVVLEVEGGGGGVGWGEVGAGLGGLELEGGSGAGGRVGVVKGGGFVRS